MDALTAITARTRTVLSLLAAIMVAGVASFIAIPVESDPDVSVPVIVVQVPHEGISPEDSERLLVRPMELELKAIEGVAELNGYAAEGLATLVIEFDSSFEPDQAVQDVREAVDRGRLNCPARRKNQLSEKCLLLIFP